MKISRTRAAVAALLLAGVAAAGLVPAQGQETPESLLPPGFDDPPAPAPAPRPAPAPAPSSGSAAPASPAAGPAEPLPAGNEVAAADLPPVDLNAGELPDNARRSLDVIGAVARGNPPFPVNAFGRGDGRFLATLMRRMQAPVASRWASIALRRALLSPTRTPRNINGADYAAERAWLLVRMGEPVAARMVVQAVDVEDYTPRLFEVAMQAALASADPAGMCPLAEPALRVVDSTGWRLARAMCAGLEGQQARGRQLLDQARGRTARGNLDMLLAEKVLGLGARGGAVTIEWDGVQRLSAWRWGLAVGTGETIPDSLYATVGPQVRYWQALAPAPEPRDRVTNAELAAAAGVFSSSGLVDLYGEIEQLGEADSADLAIARELRTAYTAAASADRVAALRTIWTSERPTIRYARLVLTARAAAAVAPDAAFAGDADRLIASMLSAGIEGPALAWRGVARRGSDGWMMLAMADASRSLLSASDFESYRSGAGERKAQLALAALAGLGKMEAGAARRAAGGLALDLDGANSWTRAIDMAGNRRDPGSVALLAAVGMQSRSWERVTPEALYHITRALRLAGLGQFARMIAVEAITRAA
ncbi:hypothetical protein ACFQ1E_16090 [Sphingomonas canadensis]|uniref:Uncharacterized protein n=1 Tax=Sphingomonas canadensis TaxID=1219257 RepID=A0ABW3H9Z0_9SPHN|nr:hypothetical protein [Sphingomonas canadensis]MCW3837566.1 hypothetical protein [Sphingomonas canadensis]